MVVHRTVRHADRGSNSHGDVSKLGQFRSKITRLITVGRSTLKQDEN